MGKPLHIALGESAEAWLSAACRAHGMPGTALGIPDDLSHGPLYDGRARMDYMRRCFRGYGDWPFQATDGFLPWRAMIERIETAKPEAVLIWSGENVSESTFLAMACRWLRTCSEPLLRVAVPGRDDRYHVALQSHAELADLFTSAQVLTESDRADLSEEFVRISSETGLLRRWNRGRILGAPLERYDPQLISCCPTDWCGWRPGSSAPPWVAVIRATG